MARAHVLEGGGEQSRIILHIALPAGNNSSGIAWTTALKNSTLRSVSVLADGDGTGGSIAATEKADLANGLAYEVQHFAAIPPGMTATQANAWLDAIHAARQTEVQGQLQAKLAYFGYTRT